MELTIHDGGPGLAFDLGRDILRISRECFPDWEEFTLELSLRFTLLKNKLMLEVRRRTLGEEHPDTLTAMANLAESLWSLGDAEAARELQEQTLEARRRTLGEEHPQTLTAMANLALSLWALGDAEAARELLEKTLEVRRRAVGEEHPDTLSALHNLLFTLRDTEGMETDPALIQELLQGVRKLPSNVEIRRIAEWNWGTRDKPSK